MRSRTKTGETRNIPRCCRTDGKVAVSKPNGGKETHRDYSRINPARLHREYACSISVGGTREQVFPAAVATPRKDATTQGNLGFDVIPQIPAKMGPALWDCSATPRKDVTAHGSAGPMPHSAPFQFGAQKILRAILRWSTFCWRSTRASAPRCWGYPAQVK